MGKPTVGMPAAVCVIGCVWLATVGAAASAWAESTQHPMPAADSRPMLWATLTVAPGDPASVRVGFIDAAGRRVVAPRYESYSYCRDANGRTTLLLATRGGSSDVLDLTGEVRRRVPSARVECIGDAYLAVTTEDASGRARTGVIAVGSGDTVLPAIHGRRVATIDSHTVNVSGSP